MTIYARWTFLLLLVLASFSDVSGSHWRGVVVQGGCFLALVLCLLPRTDKLRQLYSVPGLIPLAVLGGLFLLQLLPLPPLFIKLVSPATSRIYEETIWMVLPGRWMPLALDPKTSLTGFFLFWSALAVFIATIQLTPALELTKKTFFFLSTAAGLFSLLGLLRLVFWPKTTVVTGNGASFPAASSVLFSGNGSDSSILVAMTLPLIVGLFLALHPRGNVFGFAGQRLGPLLLTTQHLKLIAGVATLPVLAFLLITAQVWTLLITLGGLLLFAALVGLRKLDRKRGLLLVGMAVCFLVGVVLLRWGGDFTGFPPAKGQSPALMTQGADSLSTLRRFPLAGTGLGASEVVADTSGAGNGSQSVSPGGQSFLGQFLAEGGILGGVLLVWFLSLLIGRCFQAWFRRKSRTSRYLFPGVLAGIVVLIVHGLTGRFQNPLPLAVFFSFFLGLLVSASHARSRSHDVENELAFLPLSVRGVGLVLGVGLGLAVVIFHLGGGVASLSADLGKTVVPADSSPETLKSTLGDLRLATQLDPLEYRYPLALGTLALAMEDKPLALKSLSSALRLNPLNPQTLRRTGLALSASENEVVGEALLRAAAEYHPGKAQHQWDYALWLCTRSRYEDSYPYLQRIFGLEPARAGELLQLMSACGLGDEQMQAALSDIPAGWVGYGDFLLNRGTEMEAEESYELAVRFATGSKNSLALPFWRLSEFYSERNRPQEALDTVLSGLQEFPADPRLRLAAGTLYQKLGITYRAIEEYRKALLLDPNNELARLGLKELTNGY